MTRRGFKVHTLHKHFLTRFGWRGKNRTRSAHTWHCRHICFGSHPPSKQGKRVGQNIKLPKLYDLYRIYMNSSILKSWSFRSNFVVQGSLTWQSPAVCTCLSVPFRDMKAGFSISTTSQFCFQKGFSWIQITKGESIFCTLFNTLLI